MRPTVIVYIMTFMCPHAFATKCALRSTGSHKMWGATMLVAAQRSPGISRRGMVNAWAAEKPRPTLFAHGDR